jgi:Ca2+/Na+ antiporter
MGVVAAAALFFLLWWAVFRLPANRLEARLSPTERIAASLVAVIGFLSILGLALAFTGQFRAWTCVAAMLLAVCAAFAVRIGKRGRTAVKTTGQAAEAGNDRLADRLTRGGYVLLLVTGAVLYSRPGENLAGGWDPGVYLATGSHVAKEGGWLIRDKASELLTPEERQAVYGRIHQRLVKYPGFYVDSQREHTIQPQFFPLYPVWTAYFHLAGGIRAALHAGSVFAWLSLAMLLLLARELCGRAASLIAGAVLLINPAQIWFSGFQTAEVAMQFFFLASLWAWTVWRRTDSVFIAALAGGMAGLTAFTSVTGIFLVALMAAAHLPILWKQRGGLWFYAPLVLMAPLSIYQNIAMTPLYFSGIEGGIRLTRQVLLSRFTLAAAGIVVACAVLLWMARGTRFANCRRACVPAGTAGAAAAGLIMLGTALYAGDLDRSPWLPPATMLSRTGVLFAFLGMVLLARRRPLDAAVFVAVPLVFTYVFFRHGMMTPIYPWAFKRFLAVTLPIAALLIGAFWASAAGLFRARLWAPVTLLAAVFMVARPAWRGREFAFRRNWEGLAQHIETISARLPDNCVVLSRRTLGPALEFISGRTVLPVYPEKDTGRMSAALAAAVGRLHADGIPVFAVGGADDDWHLPFTAATVGAVRLDTSILEESKKPFENRVKSKRLDTVVRLLSP